MPGPATADDVIAALGLIPHPMEGGFFVETYRSAVRVPRALLPGCAGDRDIGTAIYYLLTPTSVSVMHRLPLDEVFHFYLGDPVEMLQLRPDGSGTLLTLGTDLAAGERPQAVVRGGVWQGSVLAPGGQFALIGATMAPGFDYADYEHGRREPLVAAYPDFADAIGRRLLT